MKSHTKRGNAMSSWTNDELAKIGAADELQIATLRQDGTLRNPVTIWVVRAGDELYIRAVGGPDGKWFRPAQERHQGHISARGVSKAVRFTEVDDSVQHDIDAVYRSKYHKYGARFVDPTLTPQAHAATLRLEPLS